MIPKTSLLQAAALFGCVVTGSLTRGADWPQFRGPELDKISTESDWDASKLEGQPEPLWKVDIGIGYSSPSIVGDVVYVIGFADDQEHVRRLDAGSGEVVWTHSYDGKKIDNLNAGGPSSSPTVVGDRVYTNGREGQIRCLNAESGEVIWSGDLPSQYDVKVPEWGFTSSPLLVDDKLILDAGRLIALDPDTGKEIWKSDVAHKPGYGTPTPFEFQGTMYLAHLNNDGVSVASVEDGKEVGFFELEAQFDTAAASPIIVDDTIWVSVGYDGACALLRFTGDGLEEIYQNKDLKNHFDTSVLKDGYVYGVNGQSNRGRTCTIVCMEYATGKVQWEERIGSFGSLTGANDSLIFLSDTGTVTIFPFNHEAFAKTAEGTIMDGQCWTAPVLANGVLYGRNSEGDLVAVALK